MRSLGATYKGYAFRSRLECRWYIFYEAMGEPIAYEPEAIDLGGFAYIPDFFLRTFRAWNEIKGEMVSDAAGLLMIEKCVQLTQQSGRPVILAFHDPYDLRCAVFQGDQMYGQSRWTVCGLCGRLALGVRGGGFSVIWCPRKHEEKPLAFDALRLARRSLYDAALKARQHRFGIPGR